MALAKQLPANFAENIARNAGVLLTTFDSSSWTVARANIIGATSGGINFTDTPEYKDFGEDIDNCPKNTKELKELTSREVKVSGTFVSVNKDLLSKLMGAADASGSTITPRDELKAADFNDLWLVVDYGTDSAIAIEMKDALATGGFQLQTADEEKAKFSFEFTAHYSIENPETVPYKVYVKTA